MYGTQYQRCCNCACQHSCSGGSRESTLKRKSGSSKFSCGTTPDPCSASSNYSNRNSLPRQAKSNGVGGRGNVVQGGLASGSRKSVLCPSNINVTMTRKTAHPNRKSCPPGPEKPFVQYCGTEPRMFQEPPAIVQSNKSTKAVTKAIRDYESSSVRNFVAVPYGVELYDENPCDDDVRISRADFEALVSKAWAITNEPRRDGRKCTELNQPKFNTLKKSVRDIQDAIVKLKLLPNDIEKKISNDPAYQKQIQELVTKKLNVPFKAHIYKDLVQLDPPEADRARSTEEILRQLRSAQLPPKTKDPEPKILDFNHPTFSRIRPKLPDSPPKPQEGVPLDVEQDFQLIMSEHNFREKDSNASLFYQSFSESALEK